MPHHEPYYNELAEGWLARTLTPEQEKELLVWLYTLPEHPHWDRLLNSAWEKAGDAAALPDELMQVIMREVLQPNTPPATQQKPVPVIRRAGKVIRWLAAAAVIVMVAGTWWIWQQHTTATKQQAMVADISPGYNGATLTLDNGQEILLDSALNGVVAQQQGSVARLENGQLRYEGEASEQVYNTMTTAKGRQFHLLLPDGTGVWLNSGSSIRFPTLFKKERQVYITGEAYFEVAQNAAMPFSVVAAGKARIEVLGTRFNINAYSNEEALEATLLQGKVKVLALDSSANDVAILQPGQQAVVKNKIQVLTQVNKEQVLAWKDGLFNFEHMGLEEVMRQLERWYDIEVVYEKGVDRQMQFFGEISKLNNLQEVLNILRQSGIHFRLNEKRVLTVLP